MSRFRTITVERLIDLLAEQRSDQEVIFSTDYGDHHHTEQAPPLVGELEEVQVEESVYSNSGHAVKRDDDGEDDPTFLLIK